MLLRKEFITYISREKRGMPHQAGPQGTAPGCGWEAEAGGRSFYWGFLGVGKAG